MPMTDQERAIFVLYGFRYAPAKNHAIQVTYPAAMEIKIDTNLGEVAAQAVADAYLAFGGKPQRAFFVEIQQYLTTNDLIGGVPHFTLYDERFSTDARVYKLAEFESDFFPNVSKLGLVG